VVLAAGGDGYGGHIQTPNAEREAREELPEIIGTLLFFAAVGLTAAKLNEDFGEHGLAGYAMLLTMITVYAAAIGSAYV